MLIGQRRGQTILEYVLIIIVVLAAFISIGTYVKRGLQGRWKMSVDDLGDQYDPRVANTRIQHILDTTTLTQIETMNSDEGFWTFRSDNSTTVEARTGFMAVGSY